MQIKIFILPVASSERSEDDLNRFLRSHRVLQLERHFCSENGGYWAVFVEYIDGEPTDSAPPAHRRDRQEPAQGLTENEKQTILGEKFAMSIILLTFAEDLKKLLHNETTSHTPFHAAPCSCSHAGARPHGEILRRGTGRPRRTQL